MKTIFLWSDSRPNLPRDLDQLIDLSWTPEHSSRLDLWLWYIEREFEVSHA